MNGDLGCLRLEKAVSLLGGLSSLGGWGQAISASILFIAKPGVKQVTPGLVLGLSLGLG